MSKSNEERVADDEVQKVEEENGSLETIEPKILEDLIEKNPNFLKENPEILAQITKSVEITEIRKSHSGPIPDPDTLKAYKQIYKNSPEIIFKMATKEQSFRHFSAYVGQLSALLIGLGGLGVTAYLGANEQPWLAGIIGFGSLGSLVGVFLNQKKNK